MQNDKFENRVRQKLDELKLFPSAVVWNKVEASLPKEKRRRWLVFFLLIAVVSTTGLLLLNNGHSSDKQKEQAINTPQRVAVPSPNNLPVQKQAYHTNGNTQPANQVSATEQIQPRIYPTAAFSGKLNTGNPNKADEPNNESNITSPEQASLVTNAIPAIVNTEQQESFREKFLKQSSVMEYLAKMKITIQSPGTEEMKDQPDEKNGLNGKNNTLITLAEPASAKPGISIKEKPDPKEVVKTTVKRDSLNYTASTPDKNKKKKERWQYSAQFGVGIPYTKNGINDVVFSVNTPSLVAGPSYYIPNNKPSAPSPGKVFQAGIIVERNLIGGLGLKTGLNYMYLSNHIQVGNKIDSLSRNGVTAYDNDIPFSPNSAASIKLYNNYFRLLQLPVALQYNFTRKDKFGVFLEAGASLDYMFNSNALLFDGATNTYSTSKDIFNRMLYTGMAGVGVKTAQESKIPVALGYQLSYGLNPFFKNADAQQHLPINMIYFRLYLKR